MVLVDHGEGYLVPIGLVLPHVTVPLLNDMVIRGERGGKRKRERERERKREREKEGEREEEERKE